jgi:methylglutaconyl-CoA hydratase
MMNGFFAGRLTWKLFRFAQLKRTLCTNVVEKSNKEVYLEQLQGEYRGVSVVNLNRPSKKNALGKVLLSELNQVITELEYSSPKQVQVVLVRSCVENVFCAGADLKERAEMSDEETLPFVRYLRSTFTRLESIPMPTIAVIDGFALGGGTELALACDLRVAGRNAVLGLPETTLAILPGAGGTQRLPRLVGIAKAKELIYTGTRLNAEEAVKIGLVERVTQQDEDAFSCALKLAKDMLKTGPIALRLAKQAIRNGSQVG